MASYNDEYDIARAFERIENEIISSMMANMDRHRAEELDEGYNWSQWQAEQLAALEKFKKNNAKKYGKKFGEINKAIDSLIRAQRMAGNGAQEAAILQAIKKGFKTSKISKGLMSEFFKINDRALNSLIDATTNDLKTAETAMLRMANDQYRKTIFNAQMYAATGATYEKAVDMAVKDFAAAGINCVEYKNGARHTVKDYAQMAIQTAKKRAYLTGEGEVRKKWGISTVIMNKRTDACPKCMKFAGKVLIDDVWSGGKQSDGEYPLMSEAIKQGLYHPRCRDVHTTYFEGISTPPSSKWTKEELKELSENLNKEAKQNYAKNQAKKWVRLAAIALDKDNRQKYSARAKEWEEQVKNSAKDRLGIFSNNNRDNPKYYKFKNKDLATVENEIGNLDYEVGVIFDKNGKAISCQLGISDEVQFTKHQLRLMKGNNVTHNHPLNTPPSPEDLYLLVNSKAKSLRTCGKNGTYVLEYSRNLEKLPKYEVFSRKYDDYVKELQLKYIEAVKKGMPEEEALIKLGEETWDKLYNTYGVRPVFERR